VGPVSGILLAARVEKETIVIKGLAHACFHARDLEGTIAFYRDKLGLKEAFPFKKPDGRRFGVYLHVGGRGFIEIFEGQPVSRDPKQSYQHICLEVEDIQGTVKAFRAKGVEVTDVTMGSDHSWQAWLADPDGNKIELHEYTKDSKQGVAL
jgi:catechol 2,3-dioxygenase-like lactoylglutathione lyase family enzyme